ncbi:putative homeodomain transcription factor superfamily protein, partial [Trifolium medium]|nr:putative homeodomain transcription factor superfamily protein [Trifolium medium]
GSFNEEEPEKGSNEGDLSDDHCQCYLKPRSSPYKKDHTKFMVIDTSLVRGGMPSDPRELKSVPINSVCKLEVYADGNRFKGKIYTRKVSHSTDMSKSVEQNSTKLTLTDTNRLSEGKLLKVKELRYPPVEFDEASTMATGLLSESKGGSSTDDLPRMVEAKMLICNKINENDSCRGVSNSSATSKKEAYDNNPDNDANKMVESQKSQHAYEFDDNRLKRIIKHQFNRRVRSSDSNLSAIPIKRRRLTACAKAEKSRIIENSSGGLGSDKLGFSRSSSFPDANKNVCDPISHQQNGSSTAFSANKIVEEIAAVFNSPIMSHNSDMVSKVLISPTMNMPAAAAAVLVPPSKPSSSTLPNIPTQIGSIDSINQQGEPKDKAAATQKDVSRLEKNQRKMRKDIKKLLAGQEIIQKLLLRVLENQANVLSAVPPVEDQPLPKPSTSFSSPSK